MVKYKKFLTPKLQKWSNIKSFSRVFENPQYKKFFAPFSKPSILKVFRGVTSSMKIYKRKLPSPEERELYLNIGKIFLISKF
ncbi:hypothetical protein AXF12_09835 [Capnocytophaga haemolytica]|uniref:Uncharacterized protein n=1 Tax=Capnocytophaga haemolytica TaxID=45243 RepID=A0ABN4KEB6_9FLAO|nr:hypothetical protein AXF12_09835 [Capnocytophaga haemolytica]